MSCLWLADGLISSYGRPIAGPGCPPRGGMYWELWKPSLTLAAYVLLLPASHDPFSSSDQDDTDETVHCEVSPARLQAVTLPRNVLRIALQCSGSCDKVFSNNYILSHTMLVRCRTSAVAWPSWRCEVQAAAQSAVLKIAPSSDLDADCRTPSHKTSQDLSGQGATV